MAKWQKVVVSGSSAELAGLTVTDTNIVANLTGNVTGDVSGTAGSTTGNAATATQLATARNINGVSFDGTANITVTAAGSTLSDAVTVAKGGTGLTSVADKSLIFTSATDTFSALTAAASDDGKVVSYNNSTGNYELVSAATGDVTAVTSATTNQLTVANSTGPAPAISIVTAAIANGGTGLATADQIHTFVTTQTDSTAADTSGNAATATALETARNIGGVSFDGTANINLPGVNAAGTQDTSGTAANATNAADSALLNGENKATMFTSPSFTGTATAAALTVTGNLSVAGTASFNNTTNLSVADKYILLNSGSEGSNQDSGGIVIQGASGTSGLGALFGYASGSANAVNSRRWAINSSFDADTGGDFTPEAFMSTVILSSVEGSTDQDAVAAQYKKPGNIFVDETSGTPYIYV
jgi:hypothetical protein